MIISIRIKTRDLELINKDYYERKNYSRLEGAESEDEICQIAVDAAEEILDFLCVVLICLTRVES
ncbi:hypothetical protein AKJ52_01825 [candidate division MSBL1 archaeon SCGC-AAA382C18]|uniref:Uncharacterized protein n=1 Tax=candidate division MSBL1 archaeon SCGC-AAA382C18 TaxID=1698281 RepID=A0A133VJP5_9EURY|nr:hypothetical protein AKJ52_01825 [candidate division MSBL1 archaeon SCGC-AAA382C18]